MTKLNAPVVPGFLLALLCAFLLSCSTATGRPDRSVPKTVRDFIDESDGGFADYEISETGVSEQFHRHELFYEIDARAPDVWLNYLTGEPRDIWKGPIVRFGVMYSEQTGRVFTRDTPTRIYFEEGQIFILDLCFEYWYHLPVAFEITEIDSGNMTLVFSYLQQNKSRGYQKIDFFPYTAADGTQKTLVMHESIYSSGNSYRDKNIYPEYHTLTVDEFHRNTAKAFGMAGRKISRTYFTGITGEKTD